uniref:Uncharacterized protein n=1 Tax=Arundo donax TaxID=35708 RepID=A0A0A9EYZ4_ARUDO
MDCPMQQKGDL